MKKEKSCVLFKIGQKEHMEALLKEGLVYMNPLSYFRQLEDGSPRSDPYEGIEYSKAAGGASFEVKDGEEYIKVLELTGAVTTRNNVEENPNLYCLHAKYKEDFGTVFELNNLGFDDWFVIFLNRAEFLGRLEKEILKLGYKIEHKPVEYVDKHTHDGTMGKFCKYSEHAEESEYRIVVSPGQGSPLIVKLGDISDIAMLMEANRNFRLEKKLKI